MAEILPSKPGRLLKKQRTLCQACRRLNVEELTSPAGQVYAVGDSNCDACPLCRAICSTLDLIEPEEVENNEIRLKLLKDVSDLGEPSMGLWINFQTEWSMTSAMLFTNEDDVAAVQFQVPAFRNLTTSGSPETMKLAARWFRHCVTNHECFKSISETSSAIYASRSSQLSSLAGPTRLLDLQAFGERSSDFQLVENTHLQEMYATLSHCWGTNPSPLYQTTLSTVQNHLSRIRYDDMPATFRDAISVCRQLSIRYLWIDSLCIIQDSADDWKHEAASMSRVYSNSCLTISADWSPSPDGGCFNVREAPQGLRMDSAEVLCMTNTLSDGIHSSLYLAPLYRPGHEDLDATWLSKRAWVCQERLLSRRNLHFTQDQLFWECRRAYAAEDLIPRYVGLLRPTFLSDLSIWSTEHLLRRWYTWIVPEYTAGLLTIPTDKLPAISAVAKIFHQSLQTPYLAGLWLEGLWHGLSWYIHPVHGSHQGGERPQAYVAPSWSWASVNCRVQWLIMLPLSHTESRVEIEDAATDYDFDEFGQVSHGQIRLNGPLVTNVPVRKKGSLHEAASNESRSRFSSGSECSFLDKMYLDSPGDPQIEFVDCLLLGEQTSSYKEQYFLLLVATSKERDQFKRVGAGKRVTRSLDGESLLRTITII